LSITWERAGKQSSAELALAAGWRKYNLAWRPSLLDLMPALTVYGDELTAAEKKALGLPSTRLAFRQDTEINARAKAAGVRAGDVIVGIDDHKLEMTRDQFLAFVRREYLIGDRITLRVLRDGKPLGLPMTLK
jgi:S1-C subfamily serine protease